jgi:hypothetical protein
MALAELGRRLRFRREESELQRIRSPFLEGLPQDGILRFWLLMTTLCSVNHFKPLADSEKQWPGVLQPTRTFDTELDYDDLPKELIEVLSLKDAQGKIKMSFGFKFTPKQSKASLFVATDNSNLIAILEVEPDKKSKRERLTGFATTFPPILNAPFPELPEGDLKPLLSKTAELAARCAELKLSFRESL